MGSFLSPEVGESSLALMAANRSCYSVQVCREERVKSDEVDLFLADRVGDGR
jgi:hypothetical protein